MREGGMGISTGESTKSIDREEARMGRRPGRKGEDDKRAERTREGRRKKE